MISLTAQPVKIRYDRLMTTARASSRDSILKVFADQVAKYGYSDTSIAAIAAELNLSKGTIVHHFGTKKELLSQVHSTYLERRFAEIEHLVAHIDDARGQLAGVMYALLASHRDDRGATLTFLREFTRYTDGALSVQVRHRRREYQRCLVEIIQKGIDTEKFELVDADLVALQIFGMCNYAWTWYRPDGILSIEDIAASFVRTLFAGILSGTGNNSSETDRLLNRAIEVILAAPARATEM